MGSAGHTRQLRPEESWGRRPAAAPWALELAGEGNAASCSPIPQALRSHHPAVLLPSFWGQSRGGRCRIRGQ